MIRAMMIVCCAAAAALLAAPRADAAERPNILLIFADDMGIGDPRCYNPESKIATPNIDRLAAEGIRFTDAHAAGAVCVPSRYGLLTGRYPFRTSRKWQDRPVIEEGRMTIASLLKQQGYRTAMIGKWHQGFEGGHEPTADGVRKGGPVDRGFDYYFGMPASLDIPPYFYIENERAVALPTERVEASSSEGWSPIQGAFWREGGIAPGMRHIDVMPEFTKRAVKVLKEHAAKNPGAGEPLFLYVALPGPHTPWLPTKQFAGRSGAGMYGDYVVQVDDTVGQLLKALDDAKLTESTMVIFTSDNGPVWYAADTERFGHSSTGIYRGMKGDAWEGGHRMPFIVRSPAPGKMKPGSVSDRTICLTDLLATFADLTGETLPNEAGEDSFSFLPILRGEKAGHAKRPPVIVESSRGLMTIRQGPWKLITGLGSGGFSQPPRVKAGPGDPAGQLYNLADDPGETRNVYADHPEIVKELGDALERIQREGRSRPSVTQ